jgi:peptidoglycan/LPS O-acetylase OafA/YrhL
MHTTFEMPDRPGPIPAFEVLRGLAVALVFFGPGALVIVPESGFRV